MKALFLNTSFLLAITAACFAGGAGQSIGSFSNYSNTFDDDGYSLIDLTDLSFLNEKPSVTISHDLGWTWEFDYVGDIEYSESAAENNESLLGGEIFYVTGEGYYEDGFLPTSVGAEYGPPLIGDPVNPVTGDFYIDTVDLALRGPMPLEIRRNYFSRKGGIGAYGYGWKRSLLPYLAMPDQSGNGDSKLSAAEMDGTVLTYLKLTHTDQSSWADSTVYGVGDYVAHTNRIWKALIDMPTETPGVANGTEWLEIELWEVREDLATDKEVNPSITNLRPSGVGGLANPYAQRIEKTTEEGIEVYRLFGSDGSLRIFHEKSYPIGTLTRNRPYLQEWQDNRGNKLSFEFGENNRRWDYGQLLKVQCSNGSFIGFEYNSSGLITEAYTNDGRRLEYAYDVNGDLVQVLRPDNTVVRYDYELRADNSSGDEYSAHLITRVIKPDGRILENDYDDKRRVTEQRATVGQGTELHRIATYVYEQTEEGDSLSGWTRVYDYNDSPTGTTSADAANDTNCTLYEYTNELITLTRDPLGTYVEQAWYTDRYGVGDSITAHVDPDVTPDASGVIADETDFTGFDDNSPGGFPRSLKWRKDKRGLITYFWYDSRGNTILQKTVGDLDGLDDGLDVSTTVAEYNSLNLLTYARDESGIETRTFYEDAEYPYLPTRVEVLKDDTLISVARNIYTEELDSESGFFTRGLLEQSTSGLSSANPADSHPEAAHQKMTYDYRGYVTNIVSHVTTGGWDPTANATLDPETKFFYNYRNELIESKLLGTSGTTTKQRFSYDGMGRRKWLETYDSTDTLLARAEVYYNGNGETTWENGPKADPEDYIFRDYDSAGRVIAEIRWKSQAKTDGTGVEAYSGGDILDQPITTYQYDEFGNLRRQTDPRGHYKFFEYDVLGQLTQLECFDGDNNKRLAVESFLYEAGHQISRHVDARGGITQYFYNSRGQLVRQENPDGTVLRKTYYIDGRMKQEYMTNGNYWLTTYDDANRTVTRTFYNADGTIHNDPGSGLTITEINVSDRRGNAISTTDRGGYVSTQSYDGLNRPLVSATTNAAAAGFTQEISVTKAYSKDGLLIWTGNALGELSLTEADSLGRTVFERIYDSGLTWVANELPTASPERLTTYTYDPNHHWVDSVVGDSDSSDPLVHQRVYNNTWGQPVLSVNRGDSEDRFQLTHYDLAGNKVLFQDYLGQRTRYEWDGLNRPHKNVLPDGATTEYVYNDAGDRVSRIMPGGLTEQSRYDLAGRTVSSWLENKGQKTRERSFEYYSNTPYIGLLKTSRDLSRDLQSDYTVFDAFNRTLSEIHGGNAIIQGYSVTTTYDIRGIRTGMTRDYTDDAYEDTAVTWLIDGHGQLYQETISIEGAIHSSYQQKWNTAGRRVELLTGQSGDAVQRYVFDHDPDGSIASNTAYASVRSETFNFVRGTSGLLQSQSSDWATMSHGYDTMYDSGRLMNRTTTLLNGAATQDTFATSQTWRVDNRRQSTAFSGSGLSAVGNPLQVKSAVRTYSYNVRGQLTAEVLNLNHGTSDNSLSLQEDFSLSYGFDQNKLGVRVKEEYDGSRNGTAQPEVVGKRWSIPATKLDDFARMLGEVSKSTESITAEDVASGLSSGASNIHLSVKDLDTGIEVPVEGITFNPDASDGAWSAPLDLAPGQYELNATPIDKSGSAQGQTVTSRFERQNDSQIVSIDTKYDKQGYVISRQKGNGGQSFVWDAGGRLLEQNIVFSFESGAKFTATYDPLGRRLKTTYTSFSPTTSFSTPPEDGTLLSTYDPQIHFQEVSVSFNGARTWKIYGPDSDGRYGGLHGIGGWCAAYVENDAQFFPLLMDTLGNIVAHIESGADDRIVYTPNNTSAYGIAPEETHKQWASTDSGTTTTKLWVASVWRGYRFDQIGYIHMGDRCYDPVSGRFLSPDPLGHEASIDLYSFANGDPVNYVDPTGRAGQTLSESEFAAIQGFDDSSNYRNEDYSIPLGGDQPIASINMGDSSYSYFEREAMKNAGIQPSGGEPANSALIMGSVVGGGSAAYHWWKAASIAEKIIITTSYTMAEIIASPDDPFSWVGGPFDEAYDVVKYSSKVDEIYDAGRHSNEISNATNKIAGASDEVFVLGRQVDTAVAKDWAGHNVLDIPDWTIRKNDQWVQGIIDQKGKVYLGSPQNRSTLWDAANNRPTVFSRELDQLNAAGYKQVGDYMLPPTP